MPAAAVDEAQPVYMTYQPEPEAAAGRSRRVLGLLGLTLDRFASLLLIALILVIMGVVVAAEVSPQANSAFRAVIHVDIHQTLAHFADAMGQLLGRLRPRS
jgi:hypothetical protein